MNCYVAYMRPRKEFLAALLALLLGSSPSLAQDTAIVPLCDDLPKNSWCGLGASQICRNKNGEALFVAKCLVSTMDQCPRAMTVQQCIWYLQSKVDAVK